MKFGILFPRSVEVGRNMHEAYQEWVDLGVEVERLGFWSFWTTQHHFGSERDYRPFDVPESEWTQSDFDTVPDPFPLLAYLGAKTSRLRLGTAVLVLNWDHPLYMAERIAMVDNLTNGRLEIGVSRGAGWRGPRYLGAPAEDDVARRKLAEAIEFMEKAWTGEPFSHHGEFFHMDEVIMLPKPVRERLPIIIGAHTKGSADWAARHGYPYLSTVWPLNDLPAHKANIEHYRAVATECGHEVDEGTLPHNFFMYCGETDEEAVEFGRRQARRFQITLEAYYQYAKRAREKAAGGGDGQAEAHSLFSQVVRDGAGGKGAGGKTAEDSFFGADAEVMANLDRVTDTTVESQLIGSPETIVNKIKEYQEVLGIQYFVLQTGWGGMPIEKSLASVRRFAEEVMPHFVESSSPAVTAA
jgi:alkanesulfonate monooxygenase SsuD/methylene tetrahydromethanopterin reductase-like flavin-dependent oxidoreductase (luciferase family)